MRIVQFGPYPLDCATIRGGIEASVYGTSHHLMSQNHQVYVFDLPRDTVNKTILENTNGIYVHRYSLNKKQNNYSASSKAKEILNDILTIQPDICHIHGSGYMQKRMFSLLNKHGIKSIITIHGLQNVEKKNEFRRKKTLKSFFKYILLSKSEFFIINKSEKIIVDTGYVQKEIIKYRKKRKIRHLPEICVIPQGINNSFYKINNAPQSDIILCVGAISKRKGQLLLLESFKQVKLTKKNAKLIIAGFISEKDYYEELIQAIYKYNMEEDVTVLINNSEKEIFDLYRKSKILALHTEEESQGIVFCEAMAVGLPIVSTLVGGVPFVIENNVNGLLCNYSDIVEFANNISKLLDDYELYNRIKSNNIKKATQYDWNNIVPQILTQYNEIIYAL